MPNRARGGRRNRAPTISAMADCNLPREVMAEILSRLPVKSIIRFRCVCKPFLSLFSSPNFIKTHLARTSQDPQNASLVVHSISIHYKHVMTLVRIGSIETPITPAHPFSQSRVDMDLVGSINGLVCLCSPPLGSTMFLWNPATKQLKEIPLPKKEPRTDKIDQVSLGLGFDYASNDFKVIRIVSIKPKTKLSSRVFAYSVNAESWEEIKVDFPFSVTATRSNGIAKGTPYWTGVVKQGTEEREVIISFDVKSEVFKVWPVLNFSLNKATTLRVVNFKDSLATIVYSPGRVPNELVDFHILDENSCAWRKIHTVGPVPLEVNRMCQCFINGEILIENNDGKLFLYDPKSQVVKSLQIDDAQGLSYEAFCYTESLIAVKGMKPVEDRKGQETRNRDDFLSKGFKLRL